MRTFILLFLGLWLLGSCQKEQPTTRASFILAGDETDLAHTKVYQLISSSISASNHIDLDLDGNGVLDLRLGCDQGVPGSGTLVDPWIKSLHTSCKVRVKSILDTTFVHETTLWSVDPQGNNVNIHALTYSCKMESSNYTIHSIQKKLKLVGDLESAQISTEEEFLEVSMPFFEQSTSSFEPTGLVLQGYTYYDLINHYRDCAPFDKSYLGFKLYTSDGVKLGWISLSFGYTTLNVGSWAIQN
ncbi:MAG: hypothetical protein HRT57_01390 [Crocinitomicaceae bacterium]|nr:hypothetical protein [Crocinitomicaceae bacterium]